MKKFRMIIAIFILTLIAACTTTTPPESETPEPESSVGSLGKSTESLIGTQWQLSTSAFLGKETEPLLGSEPTLMFEDETINGNAGCNRYFGGVKITGGKLSIGQLGATRMMCETNVMEAELAFLQSLETAQSFSIEGDVLSIELEGGGIMMFDRMESTQ